MPNECVKVMVRVRPLNQNEINHSGSKIIVSVDEKTKSIFLSRPDSNEEQRQFSYDAVFGINELQERIYETAAFGLVESVIEGFNGTMFAYGQTGSGKTFTMMGDPQSDKIKGIIPRTFEHIINAIESAEKNKQFLVRVSFIEIYQEEIHDLLGQDVKARCEMKEHPDEGVYIKGLVWETVKTIKEMERSMVIGNKNRSTGETLMNKDSSRSHSLFTIKIEMSVTDEKGNERFTMGKLRLVDLAGSERQSKTQATGDRLKEAQKINLSLSALGNVISALVDGKSTHIPYRDSKLTRLLQDSLGGNTKTVMIACCSPAHYNYDETLGTLRYASRAKHIQNQPRINEDPKDALLKEYADEIKRLKAMLEGKNPQSIPVQMEKDENGKVIYLYKDGKNEVKDKAMMEKLKQRDLMIEEERQQKEKLMELIKEQEKRLVRGGAPNDANKDKQYLTKFKQLRQKMKQQVIDFRMKFIQEEIQKQLLEEQQMKETQMLQVERSYQNLAEEVSSLRKAIKQIKFQNKQAENEINDFKEEALDEKEQYLTTIKEQDKELKFVVSVINQLLAPEEYQKDEKNQFKMPPFYFKDHKVKFPQVPLLQANDLIEQEMSLRDLQFGHRENHENHESRESRESRSVANKYHRKEATPLKQNKSSYNNSNQKKEEQQQQIFFQSQQQNIITSNINVNNFKIKQVQGNKFGKQLKKNLNVMLEPIQKNAFKQETNSSNLPVDQQMKIIKTKVQGMTQQPKMQLQLEATLQFNNNPSNNTEQDESLLIEDDDEGI